MYVQAHIIHMLTVAIITETNDTLILFYYLLLIGFFCGGWTLHSDVYVERDGCYKTQKQEDN